MNSTDCSYIQYCYHANSELQVLKQYTAYNLDTKFNPSNSQFSYNKTAVMTSGQSTRHHELLTIY